MTSSESSFLYQCLPFSQQNQSNYCEKEVFQGAGRRLKIPIPRKTSNTYFKGNEVDVFPFEVVILIASTVQDIVFLKALFYFFAVQHFSDNNKQKLVHISVFVFLPAIVLLALNSINFYLSRLM